MKKLTKKGTMQKIIILIVIVLTFNFIMPTYSQADFGGVLMGPIIDFVSGIGDVVMSALQFFMYDGNITMSGTAGAAGSTALTIINPFDSFLLERKSDQFDAKLAEYDADVTQEELDANGGEADITIDSSQFDKGWFSWLPGTWADKDYGIPIIKYTPEKIFSNQVPSLDVNFINPRDWTDIKDENGNQKYPNADLMNERSITRDLHSTIANWYVALRNLAIVALLSVLLYVGIRIVISSTAADKSKYKEMLMDWVIALCILFFLHYIMSFILTVTQMITEGVDSGTEIIVQVTDSDQGDFMFKTDLTGLCRLQVQYSDLGARMIYLIFYIALVVYTVMFTWTYVKRAITMAFLTLMAPLVAITYPIDKISDGKAQAFGIWLKEFIFNALLQPFHLIIYTIFLGAASEIATKNPIYAILFLAFIIPSEKLLRKMFGFDKTSTAGAMGAAAGVFGGAAAFNMLKGVVGKGKGSSGGGSSTQNKVRTKTPIKDKNEIGKDLAAFSGAPDDIRQVPENDSERQNVGQQQSPSDQPQVPGSAQQRMLDSYDEQYGTGAYDAQEREAMARGVNSGNAGDMNYSAEDYANILRDSGYEEDEVQRMVRERYPLYGTSETPQVDNNRASAQPANRNMFSRTIRGIGNVGREGMKYTGSKLKHRFASREGWRENANFAARMAVRGTTAATLGAVGLGMGIAGDDLEDVLKFGAAGTALGGTVVGGKLASAGGRVMHNANMAFQEGYYGSRNAAVMAQQAQEYRTNEENREYFQEEMEVKGKDLDKVMERAAEVNNQGITDKKAIKQTLKLEDSIKKELPDSGADEETKARIAKQQAITIAKIADRYDDDKLRTDDKYVQGVYKDFERGIKKANPQIGAHDLEQQKERMMTLLKRYKKID